jgi:hypothetical protein
VLFSKTAATGHFGDTHYENCSSHSGGAFSTMPHPPKPSHIGQTVHTRGSAYATCPMPCNHSQHTDARDEALG